MTGFKEKLDIWDESAKSSLLCSSTFNIKTLSVTEIIRTGQMGTEHIDFFRKCTEVFFLVTWL